MSPLRSLLLWASEKRWLGDQARRRRFTRRAVRRFLPGEDLDSALGAAERLAAGGIASVFHELGENVLSEAEADTALAHYLEALERASARGVAAHVSVKLTHLGLDLDRDRAAARARELAAAAERAGGCAWIDMEGSASTDATLAIFRATRETHAAVGVCLQAYLRRTAQDLEALIPLGAPLRLVKGAYLEPPRLAFPNKSDVDRNLVMLSKRMLADDARRAGARLALGSHDVRLLNEVIAFAGAEGVAPGDYELQTLYGIQTAALEGYAARGHACRVLISYGADWFPWYMRRLAERPANLWFVLRNLF